MGETLYASAIISKAIWAGLMGAWQCFKSVLRKHMKQKLRSQGFETSQALSI